MIARFFVPPPLAAGLDIALPPSAAHHAAQVLRLERGDVVTIFDGEGGEYGAEIVSSTARGVDVRVTERRAVERESPLKITLAQALIASERMDYVIQKAVELGAAAIAPVATARCVTRLDGARAQRRIEHWRQIAIASCEQCGRNRVPTVHAPRDLAAWLMLPSTARLRLLLSPSSPESLRDVAAPAGEAELLVGPEGGLAPEEEASALAAGFRAVRLGPRILRTETAGPAMLAALNALWGDWR
jgi:16S rRNA (uracil1498-N3)-methyltransferase